MATLGAMRADRGADRDAEGGAELVPNARTARPAACILSASLLLVGPVVNAIQRGLLHPTGAEDHHEAIFTEYAASQAWVATHFAEFLLVLVALAGLLVLCDELRREAPILALLAAGAVVATGTAWAVLQAVDGITLKQAVDAWVAAPDVERAIRFADAETLRWVEWGLQSYFRLLLGVTLLVLGAAILVRLLLPRWLGGLLVLGGLLSLAIGFSVGYEGLESSVQDAMVIGFQLVVFLFAVGLLIVGLRARGRAPGNAVARR
ncbi:MAG: hypothetical protein QJR09_14560 [Micrococcus sp.]|nr:hypothetical protein [Micrococcus sp.]